MSDDAGLLSAYALDGRGGARPLSWDDLLGWKPVDGVLWVHLDRSGPRAEAWLQR